MCACFSLTYLIHGRTYATSIDYGFLMEAEGQLWIKCPRPLEVARISTAVEQLRFQRLSDHPPMAGKRKPAAGKVREVRNGSGKRQIAAAARLNDVAMAARLLCGGMQRIERSALGM